MSENLTILRKGLILIAIPLLFQLVFIGFLTRIKAESIELQRQAVRTKDLLARTEGAFRTLVQAHSSIRGLLITDDPVFSRAYEESIQQLPEEMDRLRHLVQDNPPQRDRFQIITSKVELLRAWLAETNRLVRAGNEAEAAARVKDLSGKRLMDDLRREMDLFLSAAEQTDQVRRAALLNSWQQQHGFLGAGAVVTVLIALGMVLTFAGGISSRISRLTENAQRLAEGHELADPLTGRDEIARLDRVFHEMAISLAERDRENEMFIYSVSHDLRSPLVNLQGFSNELQLEIQDLRDILTAEEVPPGVRQRAQAVLEEGIPQSLHFIRTAVSRLAAIIDALLRLSRAGRVEYQWQPVDMHATISRVIESLRGTIAERGAQVTLRELPPAWGDPTAIEQIFSNLISNAVHYLDPGRPGQIEVGSVDHPEGTGEPAPLCTYYVKDNGLGIPESCQPKLFLAFQRFHTAVAPGEGIGLALVRRVLERHGGKIWVESQAGVGSTFYVALPSRPPGETS